jgi:hypothetical protein
VQAVPQHTPSAQKPETHSFDAVQVAPARCLAAHTLALVQYASVAQSVSEAHVVLHVLPSAAQMNGAQSLDET